MVYESVDQDLFTHDQFHYHFRGKLFMCYKKADIAFVFVKSDS